MDRHHRSAVDGCQRAAVARAYVSGSGGEEVCRGGGNEDRDGCVRGAGVRWGLHPHTMDKIDMELLEICSVHRVMPGGAG